uniref:RAD52 motif-containing protein 1 n=1 Tax=Podarcis muralis TaxID=64176 RepID=A0A670JE37_PODMU
MAEIVEFRVPDGNGRTLLILGLETDASEHALYLTFSAFGPLYSVRVHQNAPVAGPGYYALVKFYSARDASKAQCACNQRPLFQKSPLKVCICTRQRPFSQQGLGLSSYRCRELANHFLGFNSWSSRIITLQNISGFEDEENDVEEVRTLPRSRNAKYLCIQELTFPRYGIRTRGIGLAELNVDPSQEFLLAANNIQKLAVHRALSDAFQKILIIVLGKSLYLCLFFHMYILFALSLRTHLSPWKWTPLGGCGLLPWRFISRGTVHPFWWNALSQETRALRDLTSFHRACKTELFHQTVGRGAV